jgi:5-methylcytosine-specific restriction endonuclease McrA
MAYIDKLKDPRWQKKRLEIFQRDNFKCSWCKDSKNTLHVHHLKYQHGKEPWDYKDEYLVTLCSYCHEVETNYRKETECELLNTLALKKFSQYDLDLLINYISNHGEEIKRMAEENEFKNIPEAI